MRTQHHGHFINVASISAHQISPGATESDLAESVPACPFRRRRDHRPSHGRPDLSHPVVPSPPSDGDGTVPSARADIGTALRPGAGRPARERRSAKAAAVEEAGSAW